MTTDAFDPDLLEAEFSKPQESKRKKIEDLLDKKRLFAELDDYDDYLTQRGSHNDDDLFSEYSHKADED